MAAWPDGLDVGAELVLAANDKVRGTIRPDSLAVLNDFGEEK